MTTSLSPRPAETADADRLSDGRIRLAVLALALGGFAIGTTEFVTMGLLPQIADGVGITIPTAGHVVSAYAIGVVVGAPLVAMFAARLRRKIVLVALMVAFAAGNLGSALSPNYHVLLIARFVSGLPHGAFFGIGSVVAASLVPLHRRTSAVAMMLAGLTVANIVGVPLATLLGQHLGWQWPYVFVSLVAVATIAAVLVWVPTQPADAAATARSELSALARPQVWLTLGVGTVGFGGMFATFSYITPTMTKLTGFDDAVVPLILVVYGVGMTVGTMLSGRVAARGMLRGMIAMLAAIAVLLALFGVMAQARPTAVLGVFLLGLLPSVLVPLLQTRLMDVAGGGQSLAAALNHSTLNIANALGAWLGSVVLANGLGYEWPSRVGALLAVAGIAIAGSSAMLARRESLREE